MCPPTPTTLPRSSHLPICTRNFMFSLSLKKTHTHSKNPNKETKSKTKMLQQNKEYTHKPNLCCQAPPGHETCLECG